MQKILNILLILLNSKPEMPGEGFHFTRIPAARNYGISWETTGTLLSAKLALNVVMSSWFRLDVRIALLNFQVLLY